MGGVRERGAVCCSACQNNWIAGYWSCGSGGTSGGASGADVVIDDRERDVLREIRKALRKENLQYALDAVSENGTTGQIADLISPDTEDARIVLVLYPTEKLPDYIQYPQTSVYSCYGEELRLGD